jgi:hypothetical protein
VVPLIVGSSRGGAVAMNLNSGSTPLVLLCPAWKPWGTTKAVEPVTTILHSEADEVNPFADSEEAVRNGKETSGDRKERPRWQNLANPGR